MVFVFDRKTEAGPGDFAQASFRDLYNGYADKVKSDAFLELADKKFEILLESNSSSDDIGVRVEIARKSSSAVRADFDKKSGSLSRELTKLQNERSGISDAERENNATAEQIARKDSLDQEIDALRDQQALLNRERSAGTRLVDACPTLQYKGPWEELERTDKEVIFARLYGVYTLRSKDQGEESISGRVLDLEYARAERNRGELVQDLISQGLNP